MALFPCDQHGGRYRGAQRTIYPAIVNGSSSLRERRRLCPDCFSAARQWCEMYLVLAQGEEAMDHCAVCSEIETPYAVFVTVYDRGEERVDFYGRACRAHATVDVALALFGHQEPLREP